MKKFSCASRTTDMTQKTFPKPQPYHAGAAFLTLFEKEVLRFRKIALQTVLAPVIMGVMYLAVFGELLDDKMATFEGVTYTQFLVPGLVMMSLLQNSFANSASSLLQSKIMGSLVFIELPPFSGLQLAAAFIGYRRFYRHVLLGASDDFVPVMGFGLCGFRGRSHGKPRRDLRTLGR